MRRSVVPGMTVDLMHRAVSIQLIASSTADVSQPPSAAIGVGTERKTRSHEVILALFCSLPCSLLNLSYTNTSCARRKKPANALPTNPYPTTPIRIGGHPLYRVRSHSHP